MVRKDSMKYNYFHGYGAQLFNLEKDPGEWNDLSVKLGYFEIENRLQNLLMDRFDPVMIERKARESHPNRMLIKEVMRKQNVQWNYNPVKKKPW
jgi:hypothetical protein